MTTDYLATPHETKAGKKRHFLTVDIGDLNDPWLALCERQKQTPSVLLRAILRQVLGRCPPVDDSKPHGRRDMTTLDTGRVRRHLTLSKSESDLLERVAAAEGFTANQWITALIRARLTQEPEFGSQELDALRESNVQINAVGRNLNQIAKALNTDPASRERFGVETIENLGEAIRKHVSRVSRLIAASTDRWTLR